MADISMLFTTKLNKLDDIELDCTLSESHAEENDITDHPVEKGADITDHIRSKPVQVTLDAIVTNTPFGSQSLLKVPANFSFNPERANELYKKILDLKEARTTFTIVTSLKQYTDMAIKSITVTRDKDTSNEVRMRIVLKKVVKASSKLGKAQAVTQKASDGPQSAAKNKPAQVATDNRTVAAKTFDGIVSVFKPVGR